MCIFIPNMKFLSSILSLGGLCTDANNANDGANVDDANDTDNYARRTNHDYIGSFGRIPNELLKKNPSFAFLTGVSKNEHTSFRALIELQT